MTVIDERRTEPMRIGSGYFDAALDPGEVIANAHEQLAHVDFDTLVATGLSGTSVATLVAHALGKKCLLIRKPDDRSTHSNKRAFGELGERWIFFDDFVGTGATRKRVLAAVEELLAGENKRRSENEKYVPRSHERDYHWEPDPLPAHATVHVGTYSYCDSRFESAGSYR